MKYLNTPYKNSIAYSTVMGITDKYQLLNRKRVVMVAIASHKKEENAGQVKFFSDDLELINKRLKIVK